MRDTKTNPETKDEKTFSQAEVSELVKKEIDSARLKWEKDAKEKKRAQEEEKKLSMMSEDERKIAEFEKREKEFQSERDRYLSEKMEFEATKLLASEGLPVSFAKLLAGNDEETTLKNINMFKLEFLKEIEGALNERLKGKTPKTSSVAESNDPFLTGFGY